MHIHRREEKAMRVLEGRFRFRCGGRVSDGREGAIVPPPRGFPRTFHALGAPGRVLGTAAPGGFEGFFARCAARGPRLPDDAAPPRALAAEFGFDTTGPEPAIASDGMGGC